jgi:hypothetical protein
MSTAESEIESDDFGTCKGDNFGTCESDDFATCEDDDFGRCDIGSTLKGIGADADVFGSSLRWCALDDFDACKLILVTNSAL